MSKKIINRGRLSLCGWVEIWDENKGKWYYHDPVTNKTSWKHPRELGIFPEGTTEAPQDQTQLLVENLPQESSNDQQGLNRPQSKRFIKDEKDYKRVQYGFIQKMGEINKAYKSRYFVLYTDGELEYYAEVPRPKNPDLYVDIAFYKGEFKGSVNVKSTKFSNSRRAKTPNTIEIELHDRQFVLQFESKEDYNKWKASLEQVGCEFYVFDTNATETKKGDVNLYDLKKKNEGIKKEKIKRNLKGRAFELGVVDLKDVL